MVRHLIPWILGLAIAVTWMMGAYPGDPAHAASSPYARVDGAVHAPVPSTRPTDETVASIMKTIRFDQLAQVPIVLKLEGDAMAAYQTRENRRKEAMKALEAGPYGQAISERETALQAAKQAEAPDERQIRQRERHLEAARSEYWKRRSALRLQVLSSLSDGQQRYWIQFVMYRNLWGRMQKAEISAEQKDLVWALCGQPAAEHVEQGLLYVDPYLSEMSVTMERLMRQVQNKVAREGQRL